MPYKDQDAYRAYMRNYMRQYNRARRDILRIIESYREIIERQLGIKIPETGRRRK